MENQNLLLLAQKVSRSEATTELADYWKRRYELILNNNLFVLSEKTVQQVVNEQLLDRPSTPFGDIAVLSHLDANDVLDDIRLQSTIETAVRFLDACLDIINFNEESRFIVNQYRKIGLGFLDIAEYLETKREGSELEAIDHLGNLISNSSYRASETLAEEKKPCLNWNLIHKHLRPKSFELWFKPDSDEKTNGLALSESFDEESILATDYEIIPRRNSNLLLLPPDLEWQIWSDRDESSPKTPVSPFIPEPPTINFEKDSFTEPEPQSDDTLSPELPTFDLSSSQTLESASIPFIESLNTPETLNTQEQSDEVISILKPGSEIDMSIFETLPEEDLQGHSLLRSDATEEGVTTHEVAINPELMEMSDEAPESLEYEPIPVLEDSEEVEPELLETEVPELLESPEIEELLPAPEIQSEEEYTTGFAIGELVKVIRKGDPNEGKIYQIMDLLPVTEGVPQRYQLVGGSTNVSNIYWAENDLELVDLDVLLDEINLVSDNENSLESNLIDELESELLTTKTKLADVEMQLENLKFELANHEKIEAEKTPESTDLDYNQVINDYLESNEFNEIVNQKVEEKLKQISVLPSKTAPVTSQNRTISTLKMLQKYQQK